MMKRAPRFEYYQSHNKQWFWRLKAANGRVIADGSEGYDSRRNVLRAIATVRKAVPGAAVKPV